MKESITIKLLMRYTPAQLSALQALNQEVKIKANKSGNQITFYESAFSFDEVSFFHVQLPADFVITEEEFEKICNNNDSAKLEFDDYNQLTLNMLSTVKVSLFTAEVYYAFFDLTMGKNRQGIGLGALARIDI